MKLRNIPYVFLAFIAIALYSCEKQYEDNVKITYYPTFVFEGEEVVLHTLGTPYTDPAVSATEDGVALPLKVTVEGEMTGYSGATVDVNTADKYTITYAATNSDGYDGKVTRIVYIRPNNGDLVTSIEGLYTSTVQRAPSFATTAQYSDMQYMFIVKTGANTYSISDAIGGYYYIGRDYGYDYAAQGTIITATDIPNNLFSYTQSTIPGFGNVVDLSQFVVDSNTKTISFTGSGNFTNGVFKVKLTQVP